MKAKVAKFILIIRNVLYGAMTLFSFLAVLSIPIFYIYLAYCLISYGLGFLVIIVVVVLTAIALAGYYYDRLMNWAKNTVEEKL